MTLESPDTGGLDADSIADALTAHLRSEPGLSQVSLAAPPDRLLGGYDTLIYAFRLSNAPFPMDGPLVIRLLTQPGGIRQTAKEAAFQNAVAFAGYPAPRVVVPGGVRTIGGRVFNVMERIPGHALMEDLLADPRDGPGIAERLAEWHARLHAIPWEPIAKSLEDAGIRVETVRISAHLEFLRRYVNHPALAHLRRGVEWLFDNRPVSLDEVTVCHGDFHPANLMADSERVTGVVDWSSAQLGDPEYDVAVSRVLVEVAGPSVAADVPPGLFEAFSEGYLKAYLERRSLDPERLRYYRAQRAMRAFLRGHAAKVRGLRPDLLPRDPYPWAEPGVMKRLANVIRAGTGISLPIAEE